MKHKDYNKLLIVLLLLLIVLIPIGLVAFLKPTLMVLGGVAMVMCAYLMLEFKIEKQFVYGLAFLVPISIEIDVMNGSTLFFPSELLIGVGVVMHGIRLLKKRFEEIVFSWIDITMVVWILIMFITSVYSSNSIVSTKYSIVITSYILVFYFYLKELLKQGLDVRILLLSFCLSIGGVSLYAIYQYAAFGFQVDVSNLIAKPFFKDHTIMGAALGFAIPIATGLWWSGKKNKLALQTFWLLPLLLVLCINLWFGHSRAAWLSVAVSVGAGVVLYFRTSPKLIAMISVIVIGITILNFDQLKDKVSTNRADSSANHASFLEQTESVTNIQTDVSNLERINRWKSAWRMQEERPWFGFGPGTYQFEYIPFQDERDKTRISIENPYWINDIHGGTAHSEPLLLLAESGWGGFVIWVLLIVHSLYFFFLRLSNGVRFGLSIEDYILIGLISFLVHALVNNFLNSDKIAWLFWSSFAILSIFNKQMKLEDNHGIN